MTTAPRGVRITSLGRDGINSSVYVSRVISRKRYARWMRRFMDAGLIPQRRRCPWTGRVRDGMMWLDPRTNMFRFVTGK